MNHGLHRHGVPVYRDLSLTPQKPVDRNSSSLFYRGKPHFALLLHDMVESAVHGGFAHIIDWLPHGRAFRIHDMEGFEERVLHLFFKNQKNYSSFQRQLNFYGFKRITRSNGDQGAYYHEAFLRGRPDLACRIQRLAVKGTRVRQAADPDSEPDFRYIRPLPPVQNDTSFDQPSQVEAEAQQQPFVQQTTYAEDATFIQRGAGGFVQGVNTLASHIPQNGRTTAGKASGDNSFENVQPFVRSLASAMSLTNFAEATMAYALSGTTYRPHARGESNPGRAPSRLQMPYEINILTGPPMPTGRSPHLNFEHHHSTEHLPATPAQQHHLSLVQPVPANNSAANAGFTTNPSCSNLSQFEKVGDHNSHPYDSLWTFDAPLALPMRDTVISHFAASSSSLSLTSTDIPAIEGPELEDPHSNTHTFDLGLASLEEATDMQRFLSEVDL